MIVAIDRDFVYFNAPSHTANELDAVYVKGKKAWKVPITLQSVEQLVRLFPNEIELKELYNKLFQFYMQIKHLKASQDAQGDARLRPYQRVDVATIGTRSSVGIFNEQRTGKTPTVLIALFQEGGKHIIVCPSGLKLTWLKEYLNWVHKSRVFVVTGTAQVRKQLYKEFAELSDAVLIISYDILRIDIEHMKVIHEFDALVVDEAHRLRNYKTLQSRAVIEISYRAKRIFPLTGTPAVNHPSDVFGLFKLMRPAKYTSFWAFGERYFHTMNNGFGTTLAGLKHNRKLEFQELLNVTTIQRKRRDVMKWLPKVTVREVEVEPTPTQTKFTNELIETMRLNSVPMPNMLTVLMRLRQLSVDPSLIFPDDKSGSPKLNYILDYLDDNPNTQVIVFSMFTSFLNKAYEIIKHHLKSETKCVILTGEQSPLQKQRAVDAIQSGHAQVLLTNIVAGGVGWTLDRAETTIFTDISYTPLDNEQAKDRFIPTDPNKEYGGKEIIYLITKDSIDSNMRKIVETKQDLIKYVNDYGIKSVVNLSEVEYNKLQEKMEEQNGKEL